jgi:hypothetical protein
MIKVTQAVPSFATWLLLASALNAEAAILGPTKPSDLVTLLAIGGPQGAPCGSFTGAALFEVQQQDGSLSPFAIPDKTVLMLTDGFVAISGGGPDDSGTMVTFDPATSLMRLIDSVLFHPDASGNDNEHFSLQTGFPVKSGIDVCVGHSTGVGTVSGFVHGYLTKDR